jgi:NitT/TauT family transport system ATP-binding protein
MIDSTPAIDGLNLDCAKVEFDLPGGGEPYVVFENLQLTVPIRSFFCILGPTGCGKSTILKVAAGFEKLSRGAALFEGEEIRSPDRKRILVTQDPRSALLPWLTVEMNVAFGVHRILKGSLPKAARLEVIQGALTTVGLWEHRHKYPRQLSGGMLQRLELCRATAVEPRLLLMDEPFAALDVQTREVLGREVTSIWRSSGQTIVFVTHDLEEAIGLGTHVAVMSAGPRAEILRILDTSNFELGDRDSLAFQTLRKDIQKLLGAGALKGG